jgi:2Fe-2S ferredoxin
VLSPAAGSSILEAAVEKSVEIHHSCGGMGSCGTCRIRLKSLAGRIPDRSEIEAEMSQDRGFDLDERLSCQVLVPDHEIQWEAEALDREP